MKLEQGVTFGDLAGSLRGKFDNLPLAVLEEIDTIRGLSKIRTREEAVLYAIKHYGEVLKKLGEIGSDHEVVALNQGSIEQLRMYEIPFYQLNLSNLPRVDY